MRMRMRHISMMAVLALGAAACEDGSTNTNSFDDAALRADVALVAADAMFQDLAHMESATVWAGTGFAPEASGIEIQGERSFSRTVTFFNAGGEEQSSYDPLTTAKIHIVSSLTREVNHTFWSADIERHRDMNVTGLEGEETQRTWNGTGTGDVERSRYPEGGPERTYDMTSSAVINQVVRGIPRSENPYPLSGTITRTVHAVITVDGVEEVRDIVAVIEFDGDNTATMTVDGDTWEINLDEKGVMHRFQRRNG
jgi:hypothetical protein